MRKKLSIMLAAITVMALMAAGPGVAQTPVVPPGVDCEIPENRCIPVCITTAIQGSGFDDLSRTGTVIVPEAFFLNVLEFFYPGFATLGPCPEPDEGGGGGNGGGGGGGGGAAAPLEITQEGEQESDSGEIDQTFDVS